METFEDKYQTDAESVALKLQETIEKKFKSVTTTEVIDAYYQLVPGNLFKDDRARFQFVNDFLNDCVLHKIKLDKPVDIGNHDVGIELFERKPVIASSYIEAMKNIPMTQAEFEESLTADLEIKISEAELKICTGLHFDGKHLYATNRFRMVAIADPKSKEDDYSDIQAEFEAGHLERWSKTDESYDEEDAAAYCATVFKSGVPGKTLMPDGKISKKYAFEYKKLIPEKMDWTADVPLSKLVNFAYSTTMFFKNVAEPNPTVTLNFTGTTIWGQDPTHLGFTLKLFRDCVYALQAVGAKKVKIGVGEARNNFYCLVIKSVSGHLAMIMERKIGVRFNRGSMCTLPLSFPIDKDKGVLVSLTSGKYAGLYKVNGENVTCEGEEITGKRRVAVLAHIEQ